MEVGDILTRRNIILILISWFGVLGFDFFLHAGILAHFYLNETSFLLAPLEAFIRIPFGYAAFFLLNGLLFYLLVVSEIHSLQKGLRVGFILGLVVWSVFALALYSISTAPIDLLLSWVIGQSIELTIAGGVIGAGFSGIRLRSIGITVVMGVVVLVLLTIALQSLGIAPAVNITP